MSSLIAFSKAIGFVRDLLISAYFGTSRTADAFNYATLFTTYPLILLGGLNGPFHSATVSTLSTKSLTTKPTESRRLIWQIIFWVFLCFCLLGGVFWLSADWLMEVLFPQDLAKDIAFQTNLMLPALFSAGLMGVLFAWNALRGQELLTAINPAISSLALIGILGLCYEDLGAKALGLGVSLGVLLQIVSLCVKGGLGLPGRGFWKWSGLSPFVTMLLPAMLSSTVGSLNVYIDMIFCKSLVEGSWTAIILGNRLLQLPFGTLVGASLVSFLPRVSALRDNPAQFRESVTKELSNLLFLLMPVMILLLLFAQPFTELLLQRGEFKADSTELVTSVLFFLSFSLLTALPREVITRAFYGLGDSKTPFRVSLISIACNFLLDWWLVSIFAVGGIALSTTLTALCNSALLIFFLQRRLQYNLSREIFNSLFKLIPSAIALFCVCALFYWLSKSWSFVVATIDLGLLCSLVLSAVAGVIAYFLSWRIFWRS